MDLNILDEFQHSTFIILIEAQSIPSWARVDMIAQFPAAI